MIGQAILESANGTSKLATEDYNIFGIKSTDKTEGKSYKTEEFKDGKLIKTTDKFKQYDSFEDAINYYLDLLNRGTYAKHKVAEAKTAKEQLERIKVAGYATDLNYVTKVLNRIKEENLEKFDIGFKENLDDKKAETFKEESERDDKNNKTDQAMDNSKTQADQEEKNLVNKDKLADEINKIKILLKDGSWTKESGQNAEKIIKEVEETLLKENLTSKEYDKLKDELNNIQINILKKANDAEVVTYYMQGNKAYKKYNNNKTELAKNEWLKIGGKDYRANSNGNLMFGVHKIGNYYYNLTENGLAKDYKTFFAHNGYDGAGRLYSFDKSGKGELISNSYIPKKDLDVTIGWM
ncbi:glucosaminidase domain-containing protein [Anaerococcus sp. AGMB00486]|uniref:Glucosaminidase domain-containing protein n=1 Tax=Anaerococcus faecalis TaxID=2742993 RepID=A0ABX2N7D7_9FIRM|nr:glucosaminidase domain-containing protein [Anaerococcus faecalis]NVF10595.1 glucosaminidase domain-containing protein [Anaerococcus faecalis]